MQTECNEQKLHFQPKNKRKVQAKFDAGKISSDGGLLLLREIAEKTKLFEHFSQCFTDHRDQRYVKHSLQSLLSQRVFGLALGYEDLNDHNQLRNDPLFALSVGKSDIKQDTTLAGLSTLNRIELTPSALNDKRPDLKIVHHPEKIQKFFVDTALSLHKTEPKEMILDIDSTDDKIHGKQEGRFYHGYYRSYCFLPLYIFWDEQLLSATLKPANSSSTEDIITEISRVVGHIRERWKKVRIIIRGDSGFARNDLMTWCEKAENVDYIFGIARNKRLSGMIETEMEEIYAEVKEKEQAHRCFKELRYKTLTTWENERRVVAKVEVLPSPRQDGSFKRNSRFVVTSFTPKEWEKRALYEDLYCARGEMENRIKEQQLGLFADRTSCHIFRANQLRVWFSALAYVLLEMLRRFGLQGTKMQQCQSWIIRSRLLKIGCLFKESVRRYYISMSSSFPLQEIFSKALHQIQTSPSLVF